MFEQRGVVRAGLAGLALSGSLTVFAFGAPPAAAASNHEPLVQAQRETKPADDKLGGLLGKLGGLTSKLDSLGGLTGKLGGLDDKIGGLGIPGLSSLGGLTDVHLPIPGQPLGMFGEVIPGVLYRSAQPTPDGFALARSRGIKSVVDLRKEHEDDINALSRAGIERYVYLPIEDLHPPTDTEAETFLAFVSERSNWPILVHCNMGIMRSGTMSVLSRYAIDGVPMETAFAESIAYGGGPWAQFLWLEQWSLAHAPGDHPINR